MNFRLIETVAVLAIGIASQNAFADDTAAPAATPTPEFTIIGSAAIVSQYKFRGFTQSDNKPAVQASITISDKSGFYLSMWGSSGAGDRTDDNSIYASFNNGTEIDLYGGYSHAFAKSGIILDGGLYGYVYPNRTYYNYFEVYGDVTKAYGPISLKAGFNWAPKQKYFSINNVGGTQYSMYEFGNLNYTPTYMPALTVHGHLGHTGGGLDFGTEYLDYDFGVAYKWKALTFDISAVGTDISHKDAQAYAGLIFGDTSPYGTNSIYRYSKVVPVISIKADF